ncbi:CDP-glycerol glycerophosphotransferase family protein [Glycomyces sp. NPDC046736]|uniref:bifunctional glycosyltransferase/CDP-glycerol:glycerophosphate glycerophosphotransferase n=1 Tax=Glycomyces sp. NPDC046736 TaxID=3155615 RepID=UPI0033DB57FE
MTSVEPAAATPLLSVVVPVYNVEEYLDECLRSVAEQTLADLEVVMIDDGSTDSSAAVAAAWVERDGRFSLVRQDNVGQGGARNRGAALAKGAYLTFLDSDDIVLPDAYLRMVETLEATGSDFAVGGLERYDGSRHWAVPKYAATVASGARRTHITLEPELLHDTVVPNKVWRTSFWRENGIEFPESSYYEDIATLLDAHLRAEHVDLVPEPVFYWRLRETGTSITQNLASDVRKFTDRIAAVRRNLDLFERHGAQELHAAYGDLILRFDLRYYVDLYDRLDEDYRSCVRETVREFFEPDPEAAFRAVELFDRVKYKLLLDGDTEALLTYLALWRSGGLSRLPVEVVGDHVLVDFASALGREVGLPPALLDYTEKLQLVAAVGDVRIFGGEVLIDGSAYVGRLTGVDRSEDLIEVWLENGDTRIPAEVRRRIDPAVAARAGVGVDGAEHTAFTAAIPIERLAENSRKNVTWKVNAASTCLGRTVTGPLSPAIPGPAQRPVMAEIEAGRWVRASWIDNRTLAVRVREEPAVCTSASVDGEWLDLRFRLAPGFTGEACLSLGDAAVTAPIRPLPLRRRQGVARLPVASLREASNAADPAEEHVWQVRTVDSGSRSKFQVSAAPGFTFERRSAGDREWFARRTRSGVLRVHDRPAKPVLKSWKWSEGARLTLDLDHPLPSGVESVVVQSSSRSEAYAFPAASRRGGVRAVLDLGAISDSVDTRPLRSGTWLLKTRSNTGEDLEVGVAGDPGGSLPDRHLHNSREFAIADRNLHQAVINVGSELRGDEVGKSNQHRLQTVHYPSAKTGLRDAVLYEAYLGRQFADSPRAIFEELVSRGSHLEHLVVSTDQQVPIPEGARRIAEGSREYFEAMAQCKYIVASTFRPSWFKRAEGQVVVQTWHGTPLKRIGLDVDLAKYSDPAYHLRIPAMAAEWDYVVSASSYTSPIMRSAFAFEGALLETGLPRNDRFFGGASESINAEVRRRLGIPADRKVVLYAPTWRDNRSGPRRPFHLEIGLDLEAMATELGEDYAIVFRKHPMLVDQLPAELREFVVDASDYPDVQDLLVATDILVTDYSSLMFDFANTGRPMLFYTYDLDHYRDESNGFYFDFEDEAPGPLIRSADDLFKAVQTIDEVSAAHRERYERFRSRFCTWDDGGATARVVDEVFGRP